MPVYFGIRASILIIFGCASFLAFCYASILSKILPPSENRFLSAVRNDWYYCLMVPLTLPILVIAVYLHWLSMKLFKHA
ncbi:putative phosphatidylinositol N-acetylglucosaminyltransferase subunit Y [Dioscorea sansibarensis]